MTTVRLRPGEVGGRLTAPPSKSYTHRALVAGHLTGRRYRVENPLDSGDTRATADAVRALGTPVRRGEGVWEVRPGRRVSSHRPVTIDCGESGTTLRLAAALAVRSDRPVTFVAEGRLPTRPMEPLWRALETRGARRERSGPSGGLPVTIRGPIRGGPVAVEASESSQFASAMLMVLPTLEGDSTLRLVGPIVSKPYIDATLSVLRYHRVRAERTGSTFRIAGGQSYRQRRFRVPGDASSAAYLWAAAAIAGGEVSVDGVSSEWPQADLAVLDLLDRVGARVRRTRRGATVRSGRRRPFAVDLTASPDLYPLAGVLAAVIPGRSILLGAPHAAAKESDRRSGTARLVRALGARARTARGGLAIDGTSRPRHFDLRQETDHRLVMSAAVVALATDGPCTLADARAVRKSFPSFWESLGALAEGVKGP